MVVAFCSGVAHSVIHCTNLAHLPCSSPCICSGVRRSLPAHSLNFCQTAIQACFHNVPNDQTYSPTAAHMVGIIGSDSDGLFLLDCILAYTSSFENPLENAALAKFISFSDNVHKSAPVLGNSLGVVGCFIGVCGVNCIGLFTCCNPIHGIHHILFVEMACDCCDFGFKSDCKGAGVVDTLGFAFFAV